MNQSISKGNYKLCFFLSKQVLQDSKLDIHAIPQELSLSSISALSTYAEDQLLEKHEDRIWASLFTASESVIESAKGFSAELQQMSHLSQEKEDQTEEWQEEEVQVEPDNITELSMPLLPANIKVTLISAISHKVIDFDRLSRFYYFTLVLQIT